MLGAILLTCFLVNKTKNMQKEIKMFVNLDNQKKW
jgi:hypothetical protein